MSLHLESQWIHLVVKGVTEITAKDQLEKAFQYALNFSREKKVVVEEKIVKQGYQVAGDGFVVDGKLVFRLGG